MDKEFDLKKCFECRFLKSFERDFTDRDKVDLLQLTKNKLVDLYIHTRQCFVGYHRYGEIKFAIAEIEKLRDSILTTLKDENGYISTEIDLYDFEETVGNQIKALKEKL